MKDTETKIEKIVLNLSGEKVSLTPEQAKKLRDLLNDMFGQSVITIREPYPAIVYRPYYPWHWQYGTTSYHSTSGDVQYCSNTSSLEVKI